LVDFPDEQAKIDKAEIDAFLNQRGYNGYGNHGSAHDYFADVSNNGVNYTNILTGYYTAEHNKDYYTDANRPFRECARELALEGLRKLNNDGFDFSSLTTYPALGYTLAK
jgi:M6 family metalloprotease-like protein